MRSRPVAIMLLLLFAACSRGRAQLYPQLHAYETCVFSDGLAAVEVSGLGPAVHSRPVETNHGTLPLRLEAGRRVMFAYPNTDFYANVKVELLPEPHYEQDKQLALDGFDHTLASSPGTIRNYDLLPRLNDFEIHGLDRTKLEGGVLGVYLLVDDSERILTTIYFLNQEPARRKFTTLEEYGRLRDRFLNSYTQCVRQNQRASASATGVAQ